jgi:hypothetical protein
MESTLQYVKFQTKESPELPTSIFGHAIGFREAITGSQPAFGAPADPRRFFSSSAWNGLSLVRLILGSYYLSIV